MPHDYAHALAATLSIVGDLRDDKPPAEAFAAILFTILHAIRAARGEPETIDYLSN